MMNVWSLFPVRLGLVTEKGLVRVEIEYAPNILQYWQENTAIGHINTADDFVRTLTCRDATIALTILLFPAFYSSKTPPRVSSCSSRLGLMIPTCFERRTDERSFDLSWNINPAMSQPRFRNIRQTLTVISSFTAGFSWIGWNHVLDGPMVP